MSRKLTEEERNERAHERLLARAVVHLDISGAHEPMRSACGRGRPGGLSWFADYGEFEDRPSYRCKACERFWLRDQEEVRP